MALRWHNRPCRARPSSSTGARRPAFGRNYDFEFGDALVVINPRGLRSDADVAGAGPKARWVARHGSLTFNQYGVGFPTGGVNEAGLVVELMWLEGTRYPETDARPALSTLEFIQYLLGIAPDAGRSAAGCKRGSHRRPRAAAFPGR